MVIREAVISPWVCVLGSGSAPNNSGDMETEKLQRLYDTLEKLRPKGKYGGLGKGGMFAAGSGKRPLDVTLPNNPLYSNFVRPGAFHKRTFEDDDEDANVNETKEEDEEGEGGGEGKKKRRKSKEGEEEKRGPARELVLRVLGELGRENRKVLQKKVQKLFDEEISKRLFKSLLNEMIDAEEVVFNEDDTIELSERHAKTEMSKKEKKKKTK